MTSSARPRERLVDYAFRMAWATTRRTPEPVGTRVLEGVADRVWKSRGSGVRQLENNLRRAAPTLDAAELADLSRAALRSYFRYWHEVFRLPSWSPERTVDSVVTTGEEGLREAFGRGRGAIIALPHMANWDHAGAWASRTGMPVSTVAERLRPESLFDRFVSYREQLGMEVIALSGAGNPTLALKASLDEGRLICLLADRDLTGAGVEVPLLGEDARMPVGPAALSRITGAPLFALTLHYRGPLLQLDFSSPISARSGRVGLVQTTSDVAEWFSAGIARTPADWHMMQPVFMSDLHPAVGGAG
ncbi:MAG TPA: phosphatidylinositol mannoside acyltransferase [Nocardioidaceae bacterium]|nr:phosphatidylinositol mannoside acyltransferase [Nocardioidaceae bacterium]